MNTLLAQVEQIDIARVELMPDQPSPYSMRDWHEVAMGYDSFVYDISKTGTYLPLVFIRPQGTNYPSRPNFGLDTYVGTFSNNNGEAINVLPSLVSASLVGIDKTNQFGRNWILMSQDYFNKANGENIYLNNIGGHSGGDWWYDMMPNIFFYQLYDLYGKIGDAEYQFGSVANRMNEAVRVMGGKATPWTRAFMDYRAYDFLHMQPNPDGVHEPEAAGAFAWLLYHAYKETGEVAYLQSAEWSMEYLVNLNSNPSYELQLPYGAYIAAKMNAEIGTEYNIEKLLFWIFNRGPLRGWGTIVGNWNGLDVSGLVGEANDNGDDYAFQLNGTQQAGALVPLVRYDKRFARTIGKWMLNVSNATRLMFPGFLPDHLQDASAWSDVYDPEGVIGYEALREMWMGLKPLATGDALRSGWAATNLSLYSTSSLGYMGSIIEKTNEEKILRLDLLKTDFFRDTAYPSYLYYNPFNTAKSVTIDAGSTPVDIYDVISETFLVQNETGTTSIEIPADNVISIVLAPANGVVSFDNNKMLINEVIVDYLQTSIAYNYPPRIQALATENTTIEKNTTITIYGKGIDQETKDLIYTFFLPGDTISGLEKTATWTAPDAEGTFEIKLIVEDENQQTDTAVMIITVVSEINIAPKIISLTASTRHIAPGGTIHIEAIVEDANNDIIVYEWTTDNGGITGTGNEIDWTAPEEEGIFNVYLMVSDGRGGTASASISLLVLDPDLHMDGNMIAWYPFSGNAQDVSGNNLHGQVSGAKLTPDSLGNLNSAYFFDGVNDHIRVANAPILNFNEGITISAFVKPQLIGDKERFIISHGSWQNRWKLSITPDGNVRWTVKFTSGQVKDLDSEATLEENKNYHVGAMYNGRFMMLYINGQLESFLSVDGLINASPVDLEIGQILPDDPSYSFRGVLDEIKIYDFALTPDSIASESGYVITAVDNESQSNSLNIKIYPNPVAGSITIDFTAIEGQMIHDSGIMTILDMRGVELIRTPFGESSTKTIDISSLNTGLHILKISYPDKTVIKEFIIQ
jgi:hypothetical protein